MLDSTELGLLTDWCHARAMRWHPLRAEAEAATLLLEPRLPDRLWQRMVLTAGDDLRLQDEAGDILATASDLPALLDALDGGVGDGPGAPLTALQSGRSFRTPPAPAIPVR